jgi:hypothetical protein
MADAALRALQNLRAHNLKRYALTARAGATYPTCLTFDCGEWDPMVTV